jgi:ferrous iron transport protein A
MDGATREATDSMSGDAGGGRLCLAEARTGRRVRIHHIEAGPGLNERLLGMGFKTGETVDVRRNDGRGPVVVGIGHGRVVLGRGMAEKVWVSDYSV